MRAAEPPRGIVSDGDGSSRREDAEGMESVSPNADNHVDSSNSVPQIDSSSHLPMQVERPPDGNYSQHVDCGVVPFQPWQVPPDQLHPPPGPHMLQFYEAQMRDHAAAYASAAAGAAWAAAQIAADMANATNSTTNEGNFSQPSNPPNIPPVLPVPPQMFPIGPPVLSPAACGPPVPPSPQGHPPSPFVDSPGASMPMYAGGPQMEFANNYSGAMTQNQPSYGGLDADYGGRRRKRQQRMSPSEQFQKFPSQQQNQSTHQGNSGKGKRGRRRRLRQDGDSSGNNNGSDSRNSNPPQSPSLSTNSNATPGSNRRRVRKNMASSNSSDGGSGAPNFKKKKPRQPTDESLLGKTGVSALYEWCGKRRTTPTFTIQEPSDRNASTNNNTPTDESKQRRVAATEDFEMAVEIDGVEWGRGRGMTKSAAKQEAARRALHALLPGVVFEEASGILVQLPNTTNINATRDSRSQVHSSSRQPPWMAAESLEDLAPNLAKRLAIGQGDEEEHEATKTPTGVGGDHSKKRPPNWSHVYPGTSTTDEEDENAYYASRGASVCSALLHAMVQIDERIPQAPIYTYQVSTVPPSSGSVGGTRRSHEGNDSPSHLKRKAGGPPNIVAKPPIVVHRGSFTCTATMRLQQTRNRKETPSITYEILQAVGVGGTKREARHTASARLLALLFPECDGMVQVKQAAEAAREEYAASKALKQQTKRDRTFTTQSQSRNGPSESSGNLKFPVGLSSSHPKLPISTEQHLLRALGTSGADINSQEDESAIARQLSRQKQLHDRIASALQKLNDHDDEGRSLPDELTVDDVGRTVLRRAIPEDFHWIAKLLHTSEKLRTGHGFDPGLSPLSVMGQSLKGSDTIGSNEVSSMPPRLWSANTVVLLLCRAIAPHEDPPLGCAVLTLGFSMEYGRVLRVAQMGSKPHLPRERLIECLQSFAKHMNCSLETEPSSMSTPRISSTKVLHEGEIRDIIKSYLPAVNDSRLKISEPSATNQSTTLTLPNSRLQSVQEEGEGIEESAESATEAATEKRDSKKDQDNPCKRSRVQ